VLVVVQQGDRVIYRFQAGTTLEDTKYGLASCSKWLSGAIILRMHEKGLFRFEDAIGDHFPSSMTTATRTASPAARPLPIAAR
jgi:CubicO group peptidase (beta-lactamase class C family)